MTRFALLIRRPAAMPLTETSAAERSTSLDDLRFFALTWVAGLVFFGTLFA